MHVFRFILSQTPLYLDSEMQFEKLFPFDREHEIENLL